MDGSDSKGAQLLIRMSKHQRDQLGELAAAEGVTVRAYVLHTLLGVDYDALPAREGGQPKHRRRPTAKEQPMLPKAGDAAA